MSHAMIPSLFTSPLGAGSLEQYIAQVNAIPTLDAEEEEALARRLRLHNDLAAAQRLILAHLRFVVQVARGYGGYGLPLGDLIQEGNIGLMKAVKRFDPERGVRLVSFAVHWVRAEIHEYVVRNWKLVKVATTKAQRKLFFNLRSGHKRLGWMNRDEAEAMASDLGVSVDDVVEMEGRLSGHDLSIDPHPDNADDLPLAPVRALPDPGADPATRLEEAEWEAHTTHRLQAALATLDARSRDILQRRWLGDSKATLQDLAAEYGISAERVRQLERKAMERLRSHLPAS